jgi:hypothetical protein
MIHFRGKYWWIARRLQAEQLRRTQTSDLQISERDLFERDIGKRGSTLFLGFYSEEGIKLALDKYGVYNLLGEKGFRDIATEVDTTDLYKHRIALYEKSKKKENLIIELVLRKYPFKLDLPFQSTYNHKNYTGLAIDWLLIQDIHSQFSEKKPRLPGQKFPGLGLSSVVLELLLIICWRLNLSGIINVPNHYHNAFLYSKIFYYLNPQAQAKFLALKNTFKKVPLFKISWGVEWNCVWDVHLNKPFEWFVDSQIVPLHKDLQKLFKSRDYKLTVEAEQKKYQFTFDESKYNSCLKKFNAKTLEKCI